MHDSSQEALLLAIAERDNLFDMFEEMFSSENYHKVLMTFREDETQEDIAQELGVGQTTVSRAFSELEEYGLIKEDSEDGFVHTMPVLTHPMIQYYYWRDVIGDE